MTEQLRSSVTIYSGGTAVVTKEYAVPTGGPLKLSIPVKKRDLDKVVSSISVLGDVSIPEPLSYQPTNINPTDLTIDPNAITKDLATKLRGAKVKLRGPGAQIIEGTLVGTQDFQEQAQHGIIDRFRIVVMAEDGDIRTVEDRNIDALTFTDENDRRQIRRSLQRSYQVIRPDNAFIDVTIVPNNGTTKCAVQYVTTAPSPKTRYQLRQRGEKWELEAQAIVTNDSEEDWRTPDGQGVFVSVVTGEPIDFDTDLAEISRPQRQKVNLANDQALRAVTADDELAQELIAPSKPGREAGIRRRLPDVADVPPAELIDAEIRDVGDFTVFDCPTPVVIDANKSALVPLKTWELREVNPILFYNECKHQSRPWQAKKFKNETGITLGKGVVVVIEDGEFAGKAVLESAQPNEEAILIHALENGVKVIVEHGEVESRRVRLNISDGVMVTENAKVVEAGYTISNTRLQAFKLEIEHVQRWCDRRWRHKVEVTSQTRPFRTTQTEKGVRFSVDLPANEKVILTVRETQIEEQTLGLQSSHGLCELLRIINSNHPLAKHGEFQACLAAQHEVVEAREKIKDTESQVKTIEEEQERLKGLIPVTHSADANDLKTQVAENEKQWRELKRTTIPTHKEAVRTKEAALQEALGRLSVYWTEDRGGNGDGAALEKLSAVPAGKGRGTAITDCASL